MKKYIKIGIILLVGLIFIDLKTENVWADDYEKDYLSNIYDSSNGLEGTAVKCIYPSKEGFIWLGSYTGLYRYDGVDFKKYLIDNKSITVNAIIQDSKGIYWIGTNGYGLYQFDGSQFKKIRLNKETNGENIINKLFLDSQGVLFVGTKSGVFSIDTQNKIHKYKSTSGMVIKDIQALDNKQKIIINRRGEILKLDEKHYKTKAFLTLQDSLPRCSSQGDQHYFYIGTYGNTLLKINNEGEILKVIESQELSSFNAIYKISKDKYWVCSDKGIGLLENDQLTKVTLQINDSVEDVCMDYQGNYWFASSRQGVIQLYQNEFSNLGAYLGINETVNALEKYEDDFYVGCDSGLYCFHDKERINNSLTKACKDDRIRQIYLDQENNIWVSTYQNGIKMMQPDGNIVSYNTENSELTTNQIRSIYQNQQGKIYIATENGLFEFGNNYQIQRVVENDILNSKRILDIKEYHDELYVSTDGYGMYEISHHEVNKIYAKNEGIASGVVMKIIPSKAKNGLWLITGDEIGFLDQKKKITKVTGLPIANSLDLLLTDKDDAMILAGNGIIKVKEKDLLKKKPKYIHFNRKDGLSIDFTANAQNKIKDDMLYMCGTTGIASMDLQGKKFQKKVNIFINDIKADGKSLEVKKNKVIIPAETQRIVLDVRCIDLVHQNLHIGYNLKGVDQKEVNLEDLDEQDINYTNLKGGTYTYYYKVYDENSNCLAQTRIILQKKYNFFEEPKVRQLFYLGIIILIVLVHNLVLKRREIALKKGYQERLLKQKEDEIAKLAFKDLVTDVNNRNAFEHAKKNLKSGEIYACFSVSVNHMDYIKNKYGNTGLETVLRKAAEILQTKLQEEIEIYRVSENIFYLLVKKPIQIENYIFELKEAFEKEGEKQQMPLSFAIGAVYNNIVNKDSVDELFERCEQMRLLDEKHAEAKFIEGKMKLL